MAMTRTREWSVLAYLLAAVALIVSCGASSAEQPTDPGHTAAAASTPGELLRNGIELDGGTLLGGQPTSEQLEIISEHGYATVVNLRGADEGGTTEQQVEEVGMAYVSIPINGTEDLTAENARALAKVMEESKRPVVVHCGSGNRVGALFALKAFYVDGMSAEDAVTFGKKAGMTRLEPVITEKLVSAD